MQAGRWCALFLLVVGAGAGCGDREDSAAVSGRLDPAGSGAAGPQPGLPAETLMIEGMPEPVPVQPFEAPDGFPLRFRTVVPADMAVELVSSGEGDVVRFEAAFSGERRHDVLLSFSVMPPGTDRAAAQARVRQLAAAANALPDSTASWDLERYRLRGDQVGFLALGQHRDLWFYFLAIYPPEFGDGMGPRIDLILRRWRWADDGKPLLESS